MNLVPVLAVSANDFAQAEQLLDLIAAQRKKTARGYILIVAAPDLHAEQTKRLQIAAKIGFAKVGLLPVGWKKDAGKGKYEQMNHVFRSAAAHIGRHYKEPFLWLEPDSVPVMSEWLEIIEDEYDRQPKLYLGPIVADEHGKKYLGRVAVYPRDCSQDINSHCDGKAPFEISAGETLVHRAGKSQSFQQLVVNDPADCDKVRADAVLVHGDKRGILLARTAEQFCAVKPALPLPVENISQNAETTAANFMLQMPKNASNPPVKVAVKQKPERLLSVKEMAEVAA